jgi:putative addiction module killer protein
MAVIRKHPQFQKFFDGIGDAKVRSVILARIARLSLGNPGDHVAIGRGVWELRIHLGAGWRVYYANMGNSVVLLLGGGSKKSQQSDIDAALALAEELRGK